MPCAACRSHPQTPRHGQRFENTSKQRDCGWRRVEKRAHAPIEEPDAGILEQLRWLPRKSGTGSFRGGIVAIAGGLVCAAGKQHPGCGLRIEYEFGLPGGARELFRDGCVAEVSAE